MDEKDFFKIEKEKKLMECNICYQTIFSSEQYPLSCCQVNSLCKNCFEQLQIPYCPFCRSKFDVWPSGCYSKSLPNTSSFFMIPSEDLFSSVDDMDISRSQRRQLRRLRKLEQREQERNYNRELTSLLSKSYHSQQRQQIQDNIRQDMESWMIYEFEET